MENNQSNSAFLIIEDNGRAVREVELLKPTKPGIVFLGGNFTTTPDEVMRNLNTLKSILGRGASSNFSIYSVGYTKGHILNNDLMMNFKYNDGDFLELAGKIFLPRIMKDSKRLSFEEASKNIENIVVFGHSAGAVVMGKLMESLPEFMNLLGYSEKEQKSLMKKIEFVGYSPYGMVHAPISAYYITPINDSLNSWIEPLISKSGFSLDDLALIDLSKKHTKIMRKLQSNDFVAYYGTSFGGRFVNITTGPLRKDKGEDHGFAGVVRDENGNNPYASVLGIEVAEIIKALLINRVSSKKGSAIQNRDEFKAIYELVKEYLVLLSIYNKDKSKSEQEIIDYFTKIINLKTADDAIHVLTNKNKGDNDGWGK